jgi:hypothetical protein
MQTSIAAGVAHKGAGQADLTVPLCMVPSIKGKRLRSTREATLWKASNIGEAQFVLAG